MGMIFHGCSWCPPIQAGNREANSWIGPVRSLVCQKVALSRSGRAMPRQWLAGPHGPDSEFADPSWQNVTRQQQKEYSVRRNPSVGISRALLVLLRSFFLLHPKTRNHNNLAKIIVHLITKATLQILVNMMPTCSCSGTGDCSCGAECKCKACGVSSKPAQPAQRDINTDIVGRNELHASNHDAQAKRPPYCKEEHCMLFYGSLVETVDTTRTLKLMSI